MVIRLARAVPLLVLLVALPLAGCQATCGNVCDKLVEECDLVWDQMYNSEDCRTQCQQQEEHYEDDVDATEAFEEHLQCLLQTGCEELEEDPGVCRDEEIYIF